MNSYPSIETLYKRDKSTNRLDFKTVRIPEVAAVDRWTITEKIDGMNIRVIITEQDMKIRGRTDRANLPGDLVDSILTIFNHEQIVDHFRGGKESVGDESWSVTFYGEGYGAGIQKGNHYRPDKSFRCFDVMFYGSHWLSDQDMRGVCSKFGIPTVPMLGTWNGLPRGEEQARTMMEVLCPYSVAAQLDQDKTGLEAKSEGVVAKPIVPLYTLRGERVMWKLTWREF